MRVRRIASCVLLLVVAVLTWHVLGEPVDPPASNVSTRPSPDGAKPAPSPENFSDTPYLQRGGYYAGSKIKDKLALGGFGPSDNFPHAITSDDAAKTSSWYLLAEPDVVMEVGKSRYMRLSLVNATGHELAFDASDSCLTIVQEAKDDAGVWRSIEYLPSSWCGNSYHRVILGSTEFWSFPAARFRGANKTLLRFHMTLKDQHVYSNEFEGSVNPTQFTAMEPHRPQGIMDPTFEVPASQPTTLPAD